MQDFALEIVLARETIKEAQERISNALLGKLAPANSDDVVVEEVTDDNFNDEAEVIYQMPEFDPADAADVLAMMGQGGTITMNDIDPEI